MNLIPFLTSLRKRGYSVRTCLVGIVATILVPALVFGGWLTERSANSERALLERNSEAKGRQVLVDIEHEIALAKAMLTALSSSQFLQTENFQAFHEQSAEVAKQLGSQVVLTDAKSGQQIVNAAVPWGQPPPRNIPTQATDARKETTRSGTLVVSNVFFGPALKKYIVSLRHTGDERRDGGVLPRNRNSSRYICRCASKRGTSGTMGRHSHRPRQHHCRAVGTAQRSRRHQAPRRSCRTGDDGRRQHGHRPLWHRVPLDMESIEINGLVRRGRRASKRA